MSEQQQQVELVRSQGQDLKRMIRSLLEKLDQMSIEDLNETRISVNVFRIETPERFSRLFELFDDHSFRTVRLRDGDMVATTWMESRIDVSLFYTSGLIQGEHVVTETSYSNHRPITIDDIRVSDEAATA
jgi:hypothetical protein